MNAQPLNILFISHDAFRGGATLFLLNVQRWLKQHSQVSFTTIVCKPGEMLAEFRALGPVIKLPSPYQAQGKLAPIKKLFHCASKPLRNQTNDEIELSDLVKRIRQISTPQVIYSNTVVNGLVLEQLAILGCPVLTHVHELEHSIRRFAGENFPKTLQFTDRYIAVSKAVRDNLVVSHNVPAAKVDLIYGFVPTARQPANETSILKQALAKELAIPSDAYIVGCCGSVEWRKGSDLLVHIAQLMPSHCHDKPIHFVWVGSLPQANEFYELQYDMERAGVASAIHFIGVRKNILDYLATFDIFALLSREDPFPLVVMEAAALNIPTVCFENSGGAPEFIADDAGIAVPYLNCKLFADACIELLNNADKRSAMATKAMTRVRQYHDIDRVVPQILQLVSSMAR